MSLEWERVRAGVTETRKVTVVMMRQMSQENLVEKSEKRMIKIRLTE